MKLLPLLLTLALITPLPAEGQSRRVRSKVKVSKEALVAGTFTVSSQCDDCNSNYRVNQVVITDYQKPAGSDKETFSVTNTTDKTLAAIGMQIEYLTTKGKQIHKRFVKVDCDVPPGETRIVNIRSWDRQRSWYYAHGQKPRKQARPYEAKLDVVTLHLRFD